MVDVAAAIAGVLAPALPHLLRGGEQVAGQAVDVLGEAAWTHARRLWEKLGDAIAARPAAKEAAEDTAASPDDPEARVVFARQLRKLLEADPALARDITQMLEHARRDGVIASGDRSVAIGGAATNSVIVTGDQVRVDRQ